MIAKGSDLVITAHERGLYLAPDRFDLSQQLIEQRFLARDVYKVVLKIHFFGFNREGEPSR